jgi:hypothetical protein
MLKQKVYISGIQAPGTSGIKPAGLMLGIFIHIFLFPVAE